MRTICTTCNGEGDIFHDDAPRTNCHDCEGFGEYDDNTPCDDDYVISDCGPLGAQYYVTQLGRRFSDWDDMLVAIRADMERQQFWAGVWYVNDHGNVDAVSL